MKRGSILKIACSVLALSLTWNANAQSKENAPESSDAATPTADIVVTAMKQSASLQDVPASVSVIDNARLTQLGVSTLFQLPNLTSGVTISPIFSRANIFIRGVGSSLSQPNVDSNVALNLNGVFLPEALGGSAFFDVGRIEILPGPQGTLYGRNSTGGVVNITSRTPGDQFGIDGFIEVGNYDHIQATVGIDIPISDTLSSRTAATHNRRDGYVSNGEDDQRSTAIRETLVWQPSSTTKVTAVGTYTHGGGIGMTPLNNVPMDCGGLRCASFDPKALGYFLDSDIFQGSLTLEQELSDGITLTYIGAYSDLDHRSFNTNTTGVAGYQAPLDYHETARVHSQEARINFDLSRFKAIVGAYYFRESYFSGFDFIPAPVIKVISSFDGKSHGVAAYGQGTYSLTDAFRLTAGLRFSNTVKSIIGNSAAEDPGSGAVLYSRPFEGRLSDNRIDWRAGAEFDLSPDSMLYASIASGYSPGGFSAEPEVIGQLPAQSYKPVTLVAYAGGIKNRLLDGMLTLNLEGFYYDYKNYQVNERAATAQAFVYNAAKTTIYGFQLDTRIKPSRNDDLSANVTYSHGVADRLTTPAGNFDGIGLPFAPRWTINGSYQHAFDVGSKGAQIRASVNFKYTSSQWLVYTQVNSGFFQEAYTHTDLNLGFYAPGDRWSIQAYVRNLEDDDIRTRCAPSAFGGAACFYEAPRTYGVNVGFKF